jgi:hypothetical protein
MPRRRIAHTPVPRRLDRRRPRGNTIGAQHRPPRGRRGQAEAIAERRALALELRKAGGSYREIAQQLGVDVHTVHGDVTAELAALRETTSGRAEELRDLELQRLDQMTAGLSAPIRAGSPPAVTAAVRVSERRARLLGLDAPTATRTELSGSVGVAADPRLTAIREELPWLDIVELQRLADASDKLLDDALALVQARRTPVLGGGPPAPARATTEPQAPFDEREVMRGTGVPPAPATAQDAAVDDNNSDAEAVGTSSEIDDASE